MSSQTEYGSPATRNSQQQFWMGFVLVLVMFLLVLAIAFGVVMLL